MPEGILLRYSKSQSKKFLIYSKRKVCENIATFFAIFNIATCKMNDFKKKIALINIKISNEEKFFNLLKISCINLFLNICSSLFPKKLVTIGIIAVIPIASRRPVNVIKKTKVIDDSLFSNIIALIKFNVFLLDLKIIYPNF